MVQNPIQYIRVEHTHGSSYKPRIKVEFHDEKFPHLSEITLEMSSDLPLDTAEEYARVLRKAFGITIKVKKADLKSKTIKEGFPVEIL